MDDFQMEYIKEKLAEPSNYLKRYVAFLDMLGFKELCALKKMDCAEIKYVFNDIEFLKLKYDEGLSKIVVPSKIREKTDFAIMSDSMVISAPENKDGLLFILYLCSCIQSMLLQCGILLRGGITGGEFYKLDSIMFGPALISAYQIESTIAVYPRIVVSREIIDSLKREGVFEKRDRGYYRRKYRSQNAEQYQDDGVNTQIELLLKQSTEDSFYYVNYFNAVKMTTMTQSEKEKIHTIVAKGLKHKKEGVRMKYQWLAEYYQCSQNSFRIPTISGEDPNA